MCFAAICKDGKAVKSQCLHIANPLHLYCKLVDVGLGKWISCKVCKVYEHTAWKLIHKLVLLIPEKEKHYSA